jgi:hypothetical protein
MQHHYWMCWQMWARSLARIKVSAFGAGDRGFKSHRARSLMMRDVQSFCSFIIQKLHNEMKNGLIVCI